jgi:hypothetical protein
MFAKKKSLIKKRKISFLCYETWEGRENSITERFQKIEPSKDRGLGCNVETESTAPVSVPSLNCEPKTKRL